MGLWQGQLPLTPEEGVAEFKRRRWRVNSERHQRLVAADEKREDGYGEPVIQVEGLTYRFSSAATSRWWRSELPATSAA